MIRPVERKVIVPQLPEKGGLSVLHRALQQLAEAHNYHDDQLNKALRGGVSVANNSSQKLVATTVQMPADAPYRALTLNSGAGWANYGAGFYSAGYLMEPGGHVSLRGLVTGGTPAYSAAGVVGTLPAGYPPGNEIGFASEGGNGAYGLMRVQPSGKVVFAFSASGSPYLFLEPARWIAPNAAPPHAFVGPNWPLVIQHGFDQCRGLTIERCRSTRAQTGTTGAPVADWEDIGTGQLRINGIWGLQWGLRYDVRLRLSSEVDT